MPFCGLPRFLVCHANPAHPFSLDLVRQLNVLVLYADFGEFQRPFGDFMLHADLSASWHVKTGISVDHRVRDGAEAAQPSVQALVKYLEGPLRSLV